MTSVLNAVQTAYAAYQSGDLAQARNLLAPHNHPQALHLLGLVERRAGNLDVAADRLQRASQMDPRNHEIANNQGRVALDQDQGKAAEGHFRRALSLRPDWMPALEGLARSLNQQKCWHQAVPVWARLLTADAASIPIQYGAAMAELETGAVEAAAGRYEALISQGQTDPAIRFMRGRARLELGDFAGGLEDLQTVWRLQPSSHVLRNLANTLWMMGEVDAFEALLSDIPEDLAVLGILLRQQAGQPEAAIAAWNGLPDRIRNGAEALLVRANLAKEAGEAGLVLELAERALVLDPTRPDVLDAAISGRIMNADPDAALRLIMPLREREPNNQHWLAHQATCYRQMGDPRYEHLVQLEAHVRAYQLPVPPGYASLADFNAALAAAIEPVRGFTTHPLDQSFQSGAQTSRDLATLPDPVIQTYIRALDEPIRQYLSDIGRSADHPLTKRNEGTYRFNGCWSVRLSSGGRHVNHVHPKGWISSAYYISVPDEVAVSPDRAGWIKFGEPPFITEPPMPAQKWVQPQPGWLVLFPSFLWHGTEAISGGQTRITAPFDLVPV